MDPNNNEEAKKTSTEDLPDLEEPVQEPDAENEKESKSDSTESESPVSNFGEKSKELANNVTQTTTGALNKLNAFRESSSGKIIVITIVGILIVGIIAFVLYYIIQKTMINQTSYQLAETSAPVLTTKVIKCDGSPIPNPSAGARSSMCFWIYIYDISKYQGSVRHVFHRGQSTDSFNSDEGNTVPIGPYVALDPSSSSLYVTFGKGTGKKTKTYNYIQGTTKKYVNDDEILSKTDLAPTPAEKLKVASYSRGIVFPYIPLQRWIHVGVVVNENLNGGTITGYIDGELVLSVNQSTKPKPVAVTNNSNTITKVTPIMSLTNMNISNTGDVYIGGSPSDPIGPGFSGLVSRIRFYNYDISAQDVYTNYQQGPINSTLAALGYGIQSPIYKIS